MGNDEKIAGVRTRFAPSPTGHLHVGGARTALFSWLFARANNGVFVLRIEDTDTARSTEADIERIISSMGWLGLDWDEGPAVDGDYGPYRQMERSGLYKQAINALLDSSRAYRCFCTPERLEEARQTARREKRPYLYDGACSGLDEDAQQQRIQGGEDFVIRLRTPGEGTTLVRDLVKGDVVFENALADDFILVRTSGVPTYNFAAAVDDDAMNITHVVRGDDHLPNTPKQIQVIEALGGDVPTYAHLPLILGSDQAPLSKRHGSVSIEEFRGQGYIREAMDNYLALLGWSYDGETTLFTIKELVEKFSLDRVGSTAAVFDADKLTWMNGTYIRELDEADLAARIEEYLEGTSIEGLPGRDGASTVGELVPLVQEKMKTLADFITLTDFFFLPFEFEEKALAKLRKDDNAVKVIAAVSEVLSQLEPFRLTEIEEQLRNRAEAMEMKLGKFLQPIRIAVSGKMVTPGMFETIAVLGRQRCQERLQAAADIISGS